jgi:hypothetical protein
LNKSAPLGQGKPSGAKIPSAVPQEGGIDTFPHMAVAKLET